MKFYPYAEGETAKTTWLQRNKEYIDDFRKRYPN